MSELTVDRNLLSGLCSAVLELLERTILVSDHQVILYANPATVQLLRAGSASELIGLPTEGLSHPDSRSTAKMRRKLVEELGEDLTELPTKVVGRDGTTLSGITDMCPITIDDRTAFVYTGRLSSDRKGQGGAPLCAPNRATRHGMLEAILEVVPDIVLIHDEELILFANAACRRFLSAQSPEDLEGRPLDTIVHPDAYAAGRERRRLLLDGGRAIKCVPLKIVTLEDQAKYVTVDAHPLAIGGCFVAGAVVASAATP